MKRYIVINGLEYETLMVIKIRVVVMLLIIAMSFYSILQIQNLSRGEVFVLVCFVLYATTRLVSSFDRFDESILAKSVLGMTVGEFKQAYRGLRPTNHSSRNYFMKIYMERMILDACKCMGLDEAGLTRGYNGKIKTSKHFLLGNSSFLYEDVKLQYMVDKFFADTRYDEVYFADVHKMIS